MNKSVVIYFSNYGSTKKYAEWIAAELGSDIFEYKKDMKLPYQNYETIIIGSGLYAGGIKGIDILKNNIEIVKTKHIAIFTCGLADYSQDENKNAITKRLDAIIPQELKVNVKYFFLRGGIDYTKLSVKHKIMMGLLKKKVEMEKDLTEENKQFLETYGKVVDFSDKETIKELIECCRK